MLAIDFRLSVKKLDQPGNNSYNVDGVMKTN